MRTRRWLVLPALLAAVAGCVAAAHGYVHTMPVGTGENRASPDGRLRATINDASRGTGR